MGIFDIFSNKDDLQAAAQQSQGLQQGNAAGQADLSNGLDLATKSYGAGVAPFLTNLAATQPGQTAYANATGANGGAGTDQAIKDFRASPGYQYRLDQGSQNVMRNQAATGQLGSGATDIALQQTGQGLADQDWQKYITNLLPFLGASTANAGGVLAGNSALGNLQNANQTTAANMAYGTDVGIGNANANATLAGKTASANILGAGMNAAKTVAAFL